MHDSSGGSVCFPQIDVFIQIFKFYNVFHKLLSVHVVVCLIGIIFSMGGTPTEQ